MILTALRTYVNNTFGPNGIGGINGLMLKTVLLEIINRIDSSFKGAYTNNTAFLAGDQVTNGGNTYRRKADGTSGSSFNAAEWDLIAQGGTVADGTITAAKVVDQAITAQKLPIAGIGMGRTSFLRPAGKNLFNKNDPENKSGYFIVNTGAEVVNASYTISHYIAVTAGQTYTVTDKQEIACYNASLTPLTGFVFNRTNLYFTIPAGGAFIRLSIPTASMATYQCEAGNANPPTYVPFVLQFAGETATGTQALTTANLANLVAKKTVQSKNLFNKNDAANKIGYYLDNIGNEYVNAEYLISHYIPVKPGTTYTPTVTQSVSFYTIAKTITGTGGAYNRPSAAFTVPADCEFVRLAIALTDVGTFQVEEGGSATSYEAFNLLFSGDTLNGLKGLQTAVANTEISRQGTTGKNLFNKNDPSNRSGYSIPSTGVDAVTSGYTASHFIAVTVGQTYYPTEKAEIAYYDQYQQPLGYGAVYNRATLAITIPAGVAYVRCSLSNVNLNVWQFEKSSSATSYEGYKLTLAVETPTGTAALAAASSAGSMATSIAQPLLGKTVWVDGTSIPASGGYIEQAIGRLGGTVINKAVGSSTIRAWNKNHTWVGVPWQNVSGCISMTIAEKTDLCNNWSTGANYRANSGMLVAGSPATLDAPTIALWKSYSWENSLLPYLNGTFPMPDYFYLRNGYNDDFSTDSDADFTLMPSVRSSRDYYLGAMTYLIDIILTWNPRAKILLEGHYEDRTKYRVRVASETLASTFLFPLNKVWEKSGFSQEIVPGTGGKTARQVWLTDDVHPSSDTSGKARDRLASIVEPFFRQNV